MRAKTSLGLLIALCACGDDSTAPTTETALPVAPSAAAACATFTPIARAVTDRSSLPAWLDAVARVIPGGYAGYDATRAKPTLLLVDTTQFTAAKANIGALLQCTEFPSHLGFAVPTDAVGSARYDFTRLYAWDRALASALVSAKGVRNRQFDIAHDLIVVTVDDATAASAVRTAARGAGVPDDALSIVVFAP